MPKEQYDQKTMDRLRIIGIVLCPFCGNHCSDDHPYCYRCNVDFKSYVKYTILVQRPKDV